MNTKLNTAMESTMKIALESYCDITGKNYYNVLKEMESDEVVRDSVVMLMISAL